MNKELFGALLAVNIIGFAVIAFLLNNHNEDFHNRNQPQKVEVEVQPQQRNVRVEIPYYRSPYYLRNHQCPPPPPRCPSDFRH